MKPEPVISAPAVAPKNQIGHAVANFTPDQVAAGKRAESYHGHIIRAFEDQMSNAFLSGLELAALKESVGHGRFMEAREALFPTIPHRTAVRYIAFVGELSEMPQLAPLVNQPAQLLIADGGLKEEQKKQILAAVHDVADGKTLTQLYRDLGVIRDPKDPNAGEKKTPEQLTPEQQLQAWKERDTAVLQQAIDLMRSLITPDEERPRYFEKETRKAAQQLSIEFTKFLKRGTKEPKPGRAMVPVRKDPLSPDQKVPASKRGPKQSTWIALRTAEGEISVLEALKVPAPDDRDTGTEYEGPFNASGKDDAMAKARMLFPSKSSRHAKATEARLAKEKELHDMGEAYEAKHKIKPTPEERAKINAAARTRWAKADKLPSEKKGAK